MSVFNPQPDTHLHIGGSIYEFVKKQLLPGDSAEIYIVEGQEGFIYQLRNLKDDTLWALKVLKPGYRSEYTAWTTNILSQYRGLPGFHLSYRTCLTRPEYDELITTFPALEYAILMPWLSWKTWAGLIRSPEASSEYKPHHALNLALATAEVLWELEKRGYAHTDIAGSNIMYAPNFKQVELLDIEGFYAQDIPPPRRLSRGTPGYQHYKVGKQGQWSLYGDRFAGTILLTEMLIWWNPFVRALTPASATSFFLPEELQVQASPRWQIARDLLYSLDPTLLSLFDQAWASWSLQECPDFSNWFTSLKRFRPNIPSPTD